ncbi:cytidine deaminase-like protein [Cercophora scortea]|uniref:Cytidine deaminase-like protein n=1 Tax=Cercophora scortea TaxID=314031 RepID=A0AAE0I6N2_9PEZI|nr:cytidine deaminase-like protein [Cercophora scortea]
MELAMQQAQLSPPCPPKFCVGAVLVDADKNEIIAAGYYQELPPNRPGDPGTTHAEQCCFIKVAERHGVREADIGAVLPLNTVLYTTMEPCSERPVGRNCVDRILALHGAIKTIYVGVRKPDTVAGENDGIEQLRKSGIRVVMMDEEVEFRERVLEVTCAGHKRRPTLRYPE